MAGSDSGTMQMELDPPDIASLSMGDDLVDIEDPSEYFHDDSSINSSLIENDRHYASSGYFMPNDEAEDTRLSVQHQAFTLLLDRKLTMTRLSSSTPMRILDLGTGPGDWALAAAMKHTQSTIIATDLSPSIGASSGNELPANLHFQVDDARRIPWTFESEYFDFVHMRGLGGAFTEDELRAVYAEIFRVLKAGGTLEVSDLGAVTLNSLLAAAPNSRASSPGRGGGGGPFAAPPPRNDDPSNSYVSIYNAAVQSAADAAGLIGVLDLKHASVSLIETAGFRVQKCVRPPVSLGTWSANRRDHRAGRMAAVAMLEAFEPRAMRLLTKVLDWDPEDVRDLVEKAKQEVQRGEGGRDGRAGVACIFIVARKLGTG